MRRWRHFIWKPAISYLGIRVRRDNGEPIAALDSPSHSTEADSIRRLNRVLEKMGQVLQALDAAQQANSRVQRLPLLEAKDQVLAVKEYVVGLVEEVWACLPATD